jgi:hypothetical protein
MQMEEIEIEKLVQKYWEGETSIEEERLLRKYWAEHPGTAEHEGFAEYLRSLERVKNISVPKQITFSARSYRIQPWLKWTGMAAALLIGMFISVLWYNHYRAQQQLLAMHNELEADLMSMSKMLNEAYSESLDINGKQDLKVN